MYNFTMEDVQQMYNLYTDGKLSVWAIKESKFQEAQIEEVAVAVHHGVCTRTYEQ